MTTAPSLNDSARGVPSLTGEQRTAGAKRSLELRQARARVKTWLELFSLGLTVGERIAVAWEDPIVQGMKVYSLLCALPGVGPKKAARLCRTAGIDLDRKVQGCGVHQRDKLFILLAKL